MDIVLPPKVPTKDLNLGVDLIDLIDNSVQQSQQSAYIPPVHNYQTTINQPSNINLLPQ
jgi:hypothetical protein